MPLIVKPIEPTPTATAVPTVIATSTRLPPPPLIGYDICSYNAYNCGDFDFQIEAQACHDYCFALVGYDVHGLDGDNDGLACEALP